MKSRETKYRPREPHLSRKLAKANFFHEAEDYPLCLFMYIYEYLLIIINIFNMEKCVYANFSDTWTISHIYNMYLAPVDTYIFDLWSKDFKDFPSNWSPIS